jgi:putative inorganic carbon (hco3(-)) transporter
MNQLRLSSNLDPIRVIQVGLITSAIFMAMILGFLATEQPILAILAVVALALSLFSLIYPDAATLAFFLILLTNTATIAVKFHDVPFVVGAAFPLLLGVPFINYLVIRGERLVITPSFFLLICLFLVQCIGTLQARDIDTAFEELLTFAIEAVLIYFLIINTVRSQESLRRVILMFLLSTSILAIIPIYQQITGDFENIFWGYGQVPGEGFTTGGSALGVGAEIQARLAGAIGEKNRFAQFMLMFGMVGISQIWGARSRWERVFALVATGLAFTAFTLPFSRGAAIGFAVTILLSVPMGILSLRQLAMIIIAAIVALSAFPQYSTRLLSLVSLWEYSTGQSSSSEEVDGATKGRTTEMLAALIVWAEHPFFGVGPGQYRYYSQEIGNDLGIKRLDEERQAHNLILDIAANTGLLGLLLTLGIIYRSLRGLAQVRNTFRDSNPALANMAVGFSLAIVTYLATGIFLHHAYLRYFWTFMAVSAAIIEVANQSSQASATLKPKVD